MNRLRMAVLTGVAGVAGLGLATLVSLPTSEETPVAITEPQRQAPAALTVDVPQVPAAAEHLPPLTFELVTTWSNATGASRTTVQRITRTRDRVRLELDGGRREWLFERNPVHRDRATGYLIDHDARQVQVHHDSDLRSALQLRGWADVVMMRFNAGALASLQETGERRDVAGATFHHYRASTASAAGVIEAWWSPELLLAMDQTSREAGSVTIHARLRELSRVIDEAVLMAPASRFPAYEVADAVDLRDHRS